jgi:hypothetical protein
MTARQVVVPTLLLLAAAAPAVAQDGAPVVRVGGRLHYQWNTTSVAAAPGGAPLATGTFETRRVRLAVDVQVSDWIRGLVEPDFAMGQLQLRQAWMSFQLDSALVLRAGQFKKPFGLMLLTSSARLPVIERGVRIRGLDAALRRDDGSGTLRQLRGELLVGEQFALHDAQRYDAYDMGLAIEGRRGALGWAAGVFNGVGPDRRAENDGVAAAARLTWRAPVATPLQFGAAWSRSELNHPTAQDTARVAGNAFAVQAELGGFRRGLWLLAEASTGENLAAGERFVGAHAVAAYFHATNSGRVQGVEPAGRISYGDPDRTVAGDDALLLTPGFNLYFPGGNRLMLNWDVFLPRGADFGTQHAARAQVNLQF